MDEVGIEPTSSTGDALAMRPLRKIPAGILLPLAELILGKRDFAPLRWSDQGLMAPFGNHTVCKQTVPAQFSRGKLSGSLANRGPRKPLKRLDLNFYIITVPTLCGKLALALRSREQMGSMCNFFHGRSIANKPRRHKKTAEVCASAVKLTFILHLQNNLPDHPPLPQQISQYWTDW